MRQWSPEDGSLLWETALGLGARGGTVAVQSTEQGFVVITNPTGIHVLSAASGAMVAQWWCDPSREPDLAALVGVVSQV